MRREPTRFERAAEVFEAACDLARGEREDYLDRACGDDDELRRHVEALLAADRDATLRLGGPALAPPASGADSIPERIADFRVLERLGRGGMGVVYEAEQDRPRRTVALKLLRGDQLSRDHLRRFRHEAEVLGWLNHPGIAQVFAAGTAETPTGTQPYLALELVRGERIDVHATSVDLDTAARLELLAKVADAVHHAHQKGVIHRDLKPANILVDATGQPKVLDFGVARIVGREAAASLAMEATAQGALLGTLSYMSPEQVSGDPSAIDTRTDVYALGVIAYELLSGQKPYNVRSLSLPEASRAILEEDPTSLGVLHRRLRGDVETIVSKAMAKDKEQRYASAEELARDLRRHLANEPILARPPSASYQLKKFVRRRKPVVAALAALLFALLAGSITSTVLYLRGEDRLREMIEAENAERVARAAEAHQLERALENLERARIAESAARLEAATAQEAAAFLEALFLEASPDRALGAERTARELLVTGARTIPDSFGDRPDLRGRLSWIIGRVLFRLGLHRDAEPLLDEALALSNELGDTRLEAEVSFTLGQLHYYRGRFESATRLVGASLELHRRTETDARLLCALQAGLATCLLAGERIDEAERNAREAVRLADSVTGDQGALGQTARLALGGVLLRRGDVLGARDHIEGAVQVLRESVPPEDPDRLQGEMLWGHCLVSLERIEEAVEQLAPTLATCRRVFPEGSERTDTTRDVLANAYLALKRYDEVRALYQDLDEPATGAAEAADLKDCRALLNLGLAHLRGGDRAEGRRLLQKLTEIGEQSFGADHPLTAVYRWHFAEALSAFGEEQEALSELRAARRVLAPGVSAPRGAAVHLRLALLRLLVTDDATMSERIGIADELEAILPTSFVTGDFALAISWIWVARIRRDSQDLAGWRRALEACEGALDSDNDPAGAHRRELIGLYRELFTELRDPAAFEQAEARVLSTL